MKKAIVTGISGQDGYYMVELLSEKGYSVIGITHGTPSDNQNTKVRNKTVDIGKYNQLYDFICEEKPDEIYNFAAQSSSIYSWDNTINTCELNFMAPVAILQGIRDSNPKCRFFHASSAEVFGKEPMEFPQNEKTRYDPATPYATAKAASDYIIKNYRDNYGIYAVAGVFYNHESVRRKETFLPAKIVKTVANIKKGVEQCLYVGNVDSKRDWGFAPDYMEAAWRTLQLDRADDYVFATGIFHTVREMIEISFRHAGMPIKWEGLGIDEIGYDLNSKKVVVRIDEKFYRKYDRCNSLGNPQKLYSAIGWKPTISFEKMIEDMTDYFIQGGDR